MRILASGNVHFLNETHYEVPRPADDWLGETRRLSTKPALVVPDQPDVNALNASREKFSETHAVQHD